MKKIAQSLLLAALGVSSAALAQSPTNPPPQDGPPPYENSVPGPARAQDSRSREDREPAGHRPPPPDQRPGSRGEYNADEPQRARSHARPDEAPSNGPDDRDERSLRRPPPPRHGPEPRGEFDGGPGRDGRMGGPRPPRDAEFGANAPRPGTEIGRHFNGRPPLPPVIVVVLEANRDGVIDSRQIADAVAAVRGVEMGREERPGRGEFYPPRPRWNPRDAAEDGRPPGPPMGPRNRPDRGPQEGPDHSPRPGHPDGPHDGPQDGPVPPPPGE